MSEHGWTAGVKAALGFVAAHINRLQCDIAEGDPDEQAHQMTVICEKEYSDGLTEIAAALEVVRWLKEYDKIIAEGANGRGGYHELVALRRAAVALLRPPYNGLSDENKHVKVRHDMLFLMGKRMKKTEGE